MREKEQKEQLESMMRRPIPRKRVGIVRLQAVKEGRVLYGMKRFTTAKEAADMVRPLVEYADREMLLVLTLDNVNRPMGVEIAAVGGVDSCFVDVKSLFKFALLNNASGIIMFHNHPSGEAEESKGDINITLRVQKAANLLGIRLLDHIIIGEGQKYKSMRDAEIIMFHEDEEAERYSMKGGEACGETCIDERFAI